MWENLSRKVFKSTASKYCKIQTKNIVIPHAILTNKNIAICVATVKSIVRSIAVTAILMFGAFSAVMFNKTKSPNRDQTKIETKTKSSRPRSILRLWPQDRTRSLSGPPLRWETPLCVCGNVLHTFPVGCQSC